MPKKSSQKEAERQKTEHDLFRENVGVVENMPINEQEKVEILLIMAGAKSVASITLRSDAWVRGTEPKYADRNKLDEIFRGITKIGLVYQIMEHAIDGVPWVEDDSIPRDQLKPEDIIDNESERFEIEVASDDRVMDELKKATAEGNDKKLGQLYGYPETAITEFLKGDSAEFIERVDLLEKLKNADWAQFAHFKLSKQNWREEIKTVRKWAEIVKKMSPDIYSAYIDFRRDVKG